MRDQLYLFVDDILSMYDWILLQRQWAREETLDDAPDEEYCDAEDKPRSRVFLPSGNPSGGHRRESRLCGPKSMAHALSNNTCPLHARNRNKNRQFSSQNDDNYCHYASRRHQSRFSARDLRRTRIATRIRRYHLLSRRLLRFGCS